MTDDDKQQELPAHYEHPTTTTALVLDRDSIENMMSVAKLMASSKVTVPEHLRNEGDCLAVVMQAMQWGMTPFAVAQKTHLVNGKLGYEAQLVNAVVTASGAIKGRFHYEYRNESTDLECRVGAVIKGEAEITWGEWLKMSSVKTKNSPLWNTNPKQQMGYLQVKNWSRLYAPGAILGVYSVDELETPDQTPARIQPDPKRDIHPEMPDESFQKNLQQYGNTISSGRKSVDEVIKTLSTKYTLTEKQKETLYSFESANEPPKEGEIINE